MTGQQARRMYLQAERIKRIEDGSYRLYRQAFLDRLWLATYVADVDALVTAYEALTATTTPEAADAA